MKKTILTLGLILTILVLSARAQAAGSCSQNTLEPGQTGRVIITFSCTGDSSDGSVPNTDISAANMAILLGGDYYLYSVTAYPTSGGTAPDAADVFILDANGEDYLGSTDGGTTANKGANLISATLTNTTFPYSNFMGKWWFPAVKNNLTLKVTNQATISANYKIELVFVR